MEEIAEYFFVIEMKARTVVERAVKSPLGDPDISYDA